MKKFLLVLTVALMSATIFAAGSGDKPYPAKDIQLVVNASAGSGTDAICRQIAKLVEPEIDGEFYIVNKSDATDATGPNVVMNAKADGYTMGNLNYGSVVNAVWNEMVAGYSMDKLAPVAMVTKESDAVMVGKDSPYQTFDALIEGARKNPGKIRIGDQGIGSRVYLLTLRIEDAYDVEFNKISYSSSAAQREAILNNEIDAAITSLGDFNSLLTSGDAVGIVEFSTVRNQAYPEVPTALEIGLGEEFLSGSFIIMAFPADTPAEIVEAVAAGFEKAVASETFVNWTTSVGVTPAFMTGAELDTFIADLQAQEFKYLDDLKARNIIQ